MVYPVSKWIVPPIYKLWLRKISGLENIPLDEPFIIAANHTSYYETWLAYVILIPRLDKPMHSLANSRYWNNIFTRIILDWGRCIPVFVGKDYDAKKNSEAIEKAAACLKKGDLLQIFPEGTRSFDGKLKKGHTGVARLALKAKVPVIPMGIIDSCKVLPKGKILPRFKRAEVMIGKPMHFRKYFDKNINEKALEDVTRQIMRHIAKLINQKYNY